MKHKLLALLILFIAYSGIAAAQTDKGTFYMGGSFSYTYNSFGSTNTFNYTTGYTNYTTTNVSNFSLSPEFGYFLSKKWSIGIQPTYGRSGGTETSYYTSYTDQSLNNYSSDKYHSNVLGIGVNIRYYCMITDKFGFFPQAGISTLDNASYLKYGTLMLAANPNFVFFPTPRLGVNLGFGNIAYSLDYQTKDKTVNIGLNNNITFGLNYFLSRK